MAYRTESLCWVCGNAVPNDIDGCEWSRDGEEVPGWIVKKYARSNGTEMYEAIHVIACPKFKPNSEHHSGFLDDVGVERLAQDLVRRQVRDYVSSCKKEAKGKRPRDYAMEKEILKPGNWALDYLDMDGGRIISAIRARFGLTK